MENINNEIDNKTKLLEHQFTESMKSNFSGKGIGINNIDEDDQKIIPREIEEVSIDVSKTGGKSEKDKVLGISYFDPQTGKYKQMFVQRINHNSNNSRLDE